MDEKWYKFKMRCKNPDCKIEGGYVYWVITPKESGWEYCNICGHGAPFKEFIEEVQEINKNGI